MVEVELITKISACNAVIESVICLPRVENDPGVGLVYTLDQLCISLPISWVQESSAAIPPLPEIFRQIAERAIDSMKIRRPVVLRHRVDTGARRHKDVRFLWIMLKR